MFLGLNHHTIDDKGRLTLPAKWRAELASGVVVTRGLDECLFVFPQAKFESIAAEIDQAGIEFADARAWARYLAGMAEQIEVDKQGRILLPENLRQFAKLNGEVVVLGVVSRIEIWNPAKYRENNLSVESNAAVVAERMGHIMHRAAQS
ncbi:MAG: division/cell wall cluster transcriptional repressor MraZ [Chloroflexi bacterium]|nr:division/cell wall cluster transcriptional repressor MraZ [Chloroflexota bacterium]